MSEKQYHDMMAKFDQLVVAFQQFTEVALQQNTLLEKIAKNTESGKKLTK